MKTFFYTLFSLSYLLIAACATQNAALQKATLDYQTAAQEELIVQKAPQALEEARASLDQAKSAREEADINTLSYITQKRVEIARLEADRKVLEEKLASLRVEGKEKIMGHIHDREMADLNKQKEELAAQKSALEKQLAELKAKQTNRGLEMSLAEGALFEVGKANLKPGAARHLSQISTVLKANPDRMVLVEGHTDSTGSADLNKRLSDERADAVANYLESQGVPPTRIVAKGYGKSFPVAPNNTASGRQQNRRVEVVILNPGESPEKYMRKSQG